MAEAGGEVANSSKVARWFRAGFNLVRTISGRFEPVHAPGLLEFGASLIHAGARESVEYSAKKKMKILRLSAVAFVSIVVVGWAVVAGAGVIIQGQDEVTRSTSPAGNPTPYTEMIEGKRAKIVIGTLRFIIDLAADKVLVLTGKRKDYYELTFPPPSVIGGLIMRRILPPMVKYKKTGKHQTLAGHGCDQYTGMGEINGAVYSVEACYSTDAPGAKDYDAFVKSAMAKAGKAAAAASDEIPQGIPLELDTTITLKPSAIPPISTQKPATPRVPVEITWKTVLTSVASRSIEAAEFQPPAGLKLAPPPTGLGIPTHL
ncbi:hypothetical protein [Candidatus Binatus sp.]|uniref:hypothetical protein n=1 Tax=Candidatus Binatus sp. TaxID=2811406 RepID=UPI003BC913F0